MRRDKKRGIMPIGLGQMCEQPDLWTRGLQIFAWRHLIHAMRLFEASRGSVSCLDQMPFLKRTVLPSDPGRSSYCAREILPSAPLTGLA